MHLLHAVHVSDNGQNSDQARTERACYHREKEPRALEQALIKNEIEDENKCDHREADHGEAKDRRATDVVKALKAVREENFPRFVPAPHILHGVELDESETEFPCLRLVGNGFQVL